MQNYLFFFNIHINHSQFIFYFQTPLMKGFSMSSPYTSNDLIAIIIYRKIKRYFCKDIDTINIMSSKNKKEIKAYHIYIRGLVQGVGFRPFVYNLARQHNIKGSVENTNEYVLIKAECTDDTLSVFIDELKQYAPPASYIESINIQKDTVKNYPDFYIEKSRNISDDITQVSPDIAVCNNCLQDMHAQAHRLHYPLINCTNCGPRFTITRELPYDRQNTTMASFKMCPQCKKEYEEPSDRRFHAQPIACNHCGPNYSLLFNNQNITDTDKIITTLAKLIQQGKTIAIKGTGGYHLMCDALNEKAVHNLRKQKKREKKPFAVMFRDINTAKEHATIGKKEEELLMSWQRPIVLLKEKKALAKPVSLGFRTIGAMLPYMPFHYLLFEKLQTDVIVMTSGNISDEPIVKDDPEAKKRLLPLSDALVLYNRDIHNRTDDSVTFVVNEKEHLIRRSRGYVPHPHALNYNVNNILATGAELVNCFCLGKNNLAIMSQHIGDLKNIKTYEFYTESIERFSKLFRATPELIACDLHPDYLSTRYANETGLPLIKIQHHHAHIASCMAEHNIDEPVIGISLDGTGLGDDGNIWGGEYLICNLEDYSRYTHLEYIPLPGGDKATYEPWRTALSYLFKIYGKSIPELPFLEKINKEKMDMVSLAIEKQINTPLTSSMGRLFDAVSALCNVCTQPAFHAEAPMRLESIMDPSCNNKYSFEIKKEISFKPMIHEIISDLKNNIPAAEISAKFHHTIIDVNLTIAKKIREDTGIKKVMLSGGSFQNRFLLSNTETKLQQAGFDVFANEKFPVNDGGIALGQLVVAGRR